MAQNIQLSTGVIEVIMAGGRIVDPIIQILGNRQMVLNMGSEKRFRLLVSDGKFKTNVGMYTMPTNNPHGEALIEIYTVVKLKRYVTNMIETKDKAFLRVLLILDLELLRRGSEIGRIIGNPVVLSNGNVSNSQSSDILSTVTTNRSKFSIKRAAESEVCSIPSLNPFHNNWIIKVRVLNKSAIRHWKNSKGEGSLFSVDLADKWGEIRCTAFRDLVQKFYDLLEVDQTYLISKCLLKNINRKFCAMTHNFEMTFTENSVIKQTKNDTLIPQLQFNFTKIDGIAAMEANSFVDVIAVCKSVSDLQCFVSQSSNREFKKKEILLVDQSRTGIHLVLWGESAENFTVEGAPIIAVKNAKINTFLNTRSLNMVMSTQLKISPEIPETEFLKNWYNTEGAFIVFRNISARQISNYLNWLNLNEISSCSDLSSGVYFQVFATILYIRFDRATYKACANPDCQRKVIDLENGMYRCHKCNREYDHFKYRLLLSMNISDSYGSKWVTVFSTEAEKLLGKTADEVGQLIENDQDAVAKLFEEQQFKQFVFKCRANSEVFNDEEKIKVTVVEIKPVDYNNYSDFLCKQVEQLSGIQ